MSAGSLVLSEQSESTHALGGKTRLDVDLDCNFLTFCKLQSTDVLSVRKTSSKKEEEKNGCYQVLARHTPCAEDD